jgi:hypothetical protein
MVHPGSQKRLGLFCPKIGYGKSFLSYDLIRIHSKISLTHKMSEEWDKNYTTVRNAISSYNLCLG